VGVGLLVGASVDAGTDWDGWKIDVGAEVGLELDCSLGVSVI
jgi:hypothetical protein